MNETYNSLIAAELSVQKSQIESTVELLDGGATVPFISRYRKEATNGLDEVQIAAIRDRIEQLRDLDKRRDAILKSIEEQGKLTDELKNKILAVKLMSELEDIYLPYKPKRKTRATIARAKGLEPLALKIVDQNLGDVEDWALTYINHDIGVASIEEALQGARDIIAEIINEDADVRKRLRDLFLKKGTVVSKVFSGKEEAAAKYRDYFEWTESLAKVPSHRLLAMRRGEAEGFLRLDIKPDEEDALEIINQLHLKGNTQSSLQVAIAIKDAYKRLLKPSMETEARVNSKLSADEKAIQVFAENLHQLLLSAPLGQKPVLAIDPGFRSGCKVVCLDAQGQLVDNDTIYPNAPQMQTRGAGEIIRTYCQKHSIEAIAIGNGTASRETETFVNNIGLPSSILVVMVSESGASIYSASEVARKEFPDKDVTVRGSVSIGRRLMDPLAELVKLDPKSIGVGQYQHDVDQILLKKGLDDVVMSCVNSVGVELNTASSELLSFVSGVGPQLATNIVNYRNEHGAFTSRGTLKKVDRFGGKAYEQAAGFLRVRESNNPLDRSAVHPEVYPIVKKMASDSGCTVEELMEDKRKLQAIKLESYKTKTIGLPTLRDIISELSKPGLDPREKFETFSFAEGVESMSDLKLGMTLPGIVTNITNFGAFVDIGVHQDGLVHVSHLSDKFVSNPAEEVSVQQKVQVTVVEVDIDRKRIALSMKADPFKKRDNPPKKKIQAKQVIEIEGNMQQKLAMLKGKFGK
ncbi:MAG: RNA-binding transcriptional accessory protein [Cyclobacteriaceae bacterium]|nr:RNA-binding transcriptional accessory protein [Cyclobacteriaceae bacterium]